MNIIDQSVCQEQLEKLNRMQNMFEDIKDLLKQIGIKEPRALKILVCVELWPHIHMLKSLASVPQNVTLLGNKVIVDVIKLGRVHIGVGRSNPM